MRVLVLGASGQFGQRLCRRLARQDGLQIFLGGRTSGKLAQVQKQLSAENPAAKIETVVCDITNPQFPESLSALDLNLVIHLAGPFQGQDYAVAKACLESGVTYLDMADGREFVMNFSSLDAAAREKKIALVTGASTVPGLSSAIVEAAAEKISHLRALDYGICAGLKTGLGLATLQAVLSYCGKPYEILRDGKPAVIFGLGHPRGYDFPEPVGRRSIVDCDIPDHGLFPLRYPTLRRINFGSCIDAPGLALLLAVMSECVRKGWVASWNFLSVFIKPFMNAMKVLGSPHSGFFMVLAGEDQQAKPNRLLFEIIARDGSGLEIPVTPVVILVKRILKGEVLSPGAYPCMGLFSLKEFEQELASYPISWKWKDMQ